MIRLVGLAALAALLGGCASETAVPRRSSGLIVGSQGAGSELVFAGMGVVRGDAVGGETTRRDVALGGRDMMTAYDAAAWPAAPAPSLDRGRYLYLPRQSDQVLYFSSHWGGRYMYRSWY